MAATWVYQDPKQVQKRGEKEASWYVGWFDPGGKKCCKSCGPGSEGKKNADKLAKKTAAELLTGTYQTQAKALWDVFRADYEVKVQAGLRPRTQDEIKAALNHFARLVKPVKVAAIDTADIDRFVSGRRKEKGKKRGSLVSPATVNKELRHLCAVLTVAADWGYLKTVPKFRMEQEMKKLTTYIAADHFAAIYGACDVAVKPAGLPYPAADWWRALIVMAYMTGWRISELLALKRDDLDLEAGTAVTRAQDNKGKRDDSVGLHPVVIDHLKKLASFEARVFPFPHFKTELYKQFAAIQEEAKIKLPCAGKHKHTRFCHVYGFHDFRRAFATMNADKLTPDALQSLMRHKSYSTTQRYINIARQMGTAVAGLHVPEVLRKELA